MVQARILASVALVQTFVSGAVRVLAMVVIFMMCPFVVLYLQLYVMMKDDTP